MAKFANADGECWPSMPTLAKLAKVSDRTVSKYIIELEKSGFIITKERKTSYGDNDSNFYILPHMKQNSTSKVIGFPGVGQEVRHPPQEIHHPPQELPQGGAGGAPGVAQEMPPNYINRTISFNFGNTPPYPPNSESGKINYAEFVSLTGAEYAKLIARFGKETTGKLIMILNNHKKKTGKRYSDDYRNILSWVVSRYQKNAELSTEEAFQASGKPLLDSNAKPTTEEIPQAGRKPSQKDSSELPPEETPLCQDAQADLKIMIDQIFGQQKNKRDAAIVNEWISRGIPCDWLIYAAEEAVKYEAGNLLRYSDGVIQGLLSKGCTMERRPQERKIYGGTGKRRFSGGNRALKDIPGAKPSQIDWKNEPESI